MRTPIRALREGLRSVRQINMGRLIAYPYLFGGAFGLKSEPHHRGMKFGISLHVPDNWGRQLAAGGPEGNRTPVRKPLDMTFSECSLLFEFPLARRQQTDFVRG